MEDLNDLYLMVQSAREHVDRLVDLHYRPFRSEDVDAIYKAQKQLADLNRKLRERLVAAERFVLADL